MIHPDMTRGTVTETGIENGENAAATEVKRIVRGGGAGPENVGGGPEAVKRTIGNVAEKGARIKIRIRIKIRTKTETANVGVGVETASVTETVTEKRKRSVQREKQWKQPR